MLVRAISGLALSALLTGFAFVKNSTTGLPLKWPPGSIPVRIMADNVTPLSDGLTRAASIQAALIDPARGWNHNLGDVGYAPAIFPVGSGADNNHLNEVFFDTSAYGMAFDSSTVAVTTAWYVNNQRLEADTIFNDNGTYHWDSYRGARRAGLVDIQRVTFHELGHALGLDHPDEAGQTVTAIMNGHVTDTDAPAADDVAGAQRLYGPPGVPSNDNFAAAFLLTGSSATVTGVNTNATKESGEPNHAANSGGRSVWWRWTAPSAGNVNVTTAGSVFDTILGVYVGGSVNALTNITSNDDVQSGVIQSSSVNFSALAGTTYYFAVDGFNRNDGHGADSAGITLNLSLGGAGTITTTSTTSSIGSSSTSIATTSSTIPPTSGSSGGGGGAFGGWSYGALALVCLLRWRLKKK